MMPPSGHQAFLLTPSGAGAIAVVRVVGPDALGIVSGIFRGKGKAALPDESTDRLLYGRLVDDEEVIDDVLVSFAGRMVVGESDDGVPAVDISCHGGVRVVERILRVLECRGVAARTKDESILAAWPARTIVEREAIEAIARARTERAVRFAAGLRAHLPARLRELADLVSDDPAAARVELKSMIAGYPAACVLLGGATVALVGPPNSGKSTLFNRLVGRRAAVTSAIPGTTRDWLAEWVEIDGVPVQFIDTAGRSEAADSLEQLAVKHGEWRARLADLILVVLDGSRGLEDAPQGGPMRTSAAASSFTVANKSDLGLVWGEADLRRTQPSLSPELACVSAMTGTGMEELHLKVLGALSIAGLDETKLCFFTERQVDMANAALACGVCSDLGEVIGRRLIGL